MEAVVYLFVFFSWTRHSYSVTFDMESVPQASMQQCEANGAALKGVYSEIKYKCIEGVLPIATQK